MKHDENSEVHSSSSSPPQEEIGMDNNGVITTTNSSNKRTMIKIDENYSLASFDMSLGDVSIDPTEDDSPPPSGDHKQTEVEQKTRSLTQHVRACRVLVLLLFVVACVVVTTIAYLYLRKNQQDDYMDSYSHYVETITTSTTTQMSLLKDSVSSLAEQYTAAALAENVSFPYVTLPMIEVAGKNVRQLSGIEFLIYTPVVTNATDWGSYSEQHQGWIQNSIQVVQLEEPYSNLQDYYTNTSILPYIWQMSSDDDATHTIIPAEGSSFAPCWQSSPPPFDPSSFINLDLLARSDAASLITAVFLAKEGLLSSVLPLDDISQGGVPDDLHNAFHEQYVTHLQGASYYDHPHSIYGQPVYSQLHGTEMVATIFGIFTWDRFFSDLLPEGVSGIYLVLDNSCGQQYTYRVVGNMSEYLGEGDLHEGNYDSTKRVFALTEDHTAALGGHCVYNITTYSSAEFQNMSQDNMNIVFAISIAVIFGIMLLAFLFYDRFVRRRNDQVASAAARSDAILSSLFPASIRERLFAEKQHEESKPLSKSKSAKYKKTINATKSRLRSYLNSGEFSEHDNDETINQESSIAFKTKPIADLFPETTIMFGDIAGFTAWSSVREPSQVFILLETIYHSFDEIARRRRVFKVETVGDCYVAVTGLPDPQKDHAVIMARFARECMMKVRSLTKRLEVILGPDTGDLAMRIGLHSGPVTAGVLRGERSRFQLFGDTMNTASRMESTGTRDRIQISQETANLLQEAGKSTWFTPREDKVVAKGKGELMTFWLIVGGSEAGSSGLSSGSGNESLHAMENVDIALLDSAAQIFDAKTTRLIDWNVDVLIRLLKQIVARRNATPPSLKDNSIAPNEGRYQRRGRPVMDEVKEIITLPKFNAKAALEQEDPEDVVLPDEVMEQLHDYVCNIAAIYRDNAFHNFEHASHVTMSVTKLLSRIIAPSEFDFQEYDEDKHGKKKIASTLHDHTYGITSDPLTQFACVFSALIHDVDHTGVPNAQLVKENTRISEYYKGKSVAEQNSVDLAWDLLMDDNYKSLRKTIYTTDAELRRFRQLVVNSVMATDIVDKELKALRNLRWDRAFSEAAKSEIDATEDRNRKATIVIEHLIQASDVAHTMQHWHIYRKWNERFFMECYEAYKNGRAETDPAEGWYKGEIGFFDFYIIPLAKKLKDCGVFGVSSDEYLNYAIKNREEWEIRGREIVDEMLETILKPGQANPLLGAPKEPVIIASPQMMSEVARIA